MKAADFIMYCRSAPVGKWIRFYDDAHRELLDVYKSVWEGVDYYSFRYGLVRIEEVPSIEPFGFNQDYVELISENCRNVIIELYDLRYIGYDDEVEFKISERGAGSEEYEKSEKNAMWDRD